MIQKLQKLQKYDEVFESVLNEGITAGQVASMRDGFYNQSYKLKAYTFYNWYKTEFEPWLKAGEPEDGIENIYTYGMNIAKAPKKAKGEVFIDIIKTKEFKAWLEDTWSDINKKPDSEEVYASIKQIFKKIV